MYQKSICLLCQCVNAVFRRGAGLSHIRLDVRAGLLEPVWTPFGGLAYHCPCLPDLVEQGPLTAPS
jgi:hypothetical protein